MKGNSKNYYSFRSQCISESSFRITEYVKHAWMAVSTKREREQVLDDYELNGQKRSRKEPVRLEMLGATTYPNISTETAPSGEPPNGNSMWMNKTIIETMSKSEGTKLTKQFIVDMLKVGKTTYSFDGGVYKIYNKWKKSGVAPRGKGHPNSVDTDVVASSTQKLLNNCSSNSTVVKLCHVKDVPGGQL